MTLLQNIVAILSTISAILSIVVFFRKPTKYRIPWLFVCLIAGAVLFFLFQQNKNSDSDTTSKKPTASNNDSIKSSPTDNGNTVVIIPTNNTGQKESGTVKVVTQSEPVKETEKPITLPQDKTDENISNYINLASAKSDIAVVVLDDNNRQMNSFAAEIANLYQSKGHTVTVSLFKNDFFSSKYLNEVGSANKSVLDKLGLASQVDYIVFAKYSNYFDPGEQVKWISRANLEVSIISCVSKSVKDGFEIPISSGHFDKQNAEKGAKEKILSAYSTSHLNL